MATESIILDGQKLSGEDHHGVWTVSGLDGWWSSPEPKGENVARENADGDFDLPTYYEARYITITGSLRAKNHEMQHRAINRFTALVRKSARLQVIGHGPAQWADVKRASGFKMEPITDTYSTWQARVKAPNPRKFGDVNEFRGVTGEAIRTFHRGNYDAAPLIYVNGSMPGGYRMTCLGQTVTVNVPAVEGVWHRIDFRLRRLRVGGSVVLAAFTTNGFWVVPPGQNADVVITPLAGGSGAATISVPDTYI